jgi:hypothetical protein
MAQPMVTTGAFVINYMVLYLPANQVGKVFASVWSQGLTACQFNLLCADKKTGLIVGWRYVL